MQRVTNNVKARYRRKGLVTSSSIWPPFHAQSFTSLALVHQKVTQLQAKKVASKIARVRATGDIHLIPDLTSSMKLDNIHQIFTPVTSNDQTQCPMSILIEGHPGIGKTTLVKEMCLQWANNQLLTSDKLVLLLMLRDPNVQKITNTEQLVRYTQSTGQVQCVLSYLQNNNGVGVTLIIDGFDELSTELRQRSFFREVIKGDVLHNARVVVTSRPSASACLHWFVQRRIEVLGFEKSSKEQYVDNALKDTPEQLHELKAHFQQYPNIDALCYIPLNMAIIVYLCLLGSLPSTATKMYESFIINTIRRHWKKVGKTPNSTSITQIEKFPQPVSEALQQLQKVAFDGLVRDKIVFTIEELPVLCKDDPTCYGLLQSTECYSAEEDTPTQSFNFLHLGIQEFLAAKFVTTLPENEVLTLLKESFIVADDDDNFYYGDNYHAPNPDSKSVRLSNMWILYCGITSGQCKTLRHYLTTHGNPFNWPRDNYDNKEDNDILLSPHYAHMTNSHKQQIGPKLSHPSTTSTMSQRFDFLQSMSINSSITPTTHPIRQRRGQQITSYPQPYHLPTVYTRIDSLVTSEKMTGPFQQELTFDQRISNTGTISQNVWKDPVKVLYLFQCFQEAQDNELCEVLSKSFDSGEIDISHNSLLPHQVVSLGFFLSRSHRKWKKLDLTECHIGYRGMNIIHQYLCGDKTNKQEITEINLGKNGLTGASSHLIADIISHLQPQTLWLYHNYITNVRDISTAVINTSTVKVLGISGNGLTAQEAVAISDMMICLEELNIGDNKLGDHGAELLPKGITNNKTLRNLDINNNNIGPSGATAIANALTMNTSLQQLSINDNNIGPSGATAIANALTINTSLQQLYMDNNKVGQDGATAIAKAITNNKTLKRLSLYDATMDKESAMIIMKSLHCNDTITKLKLPIRLCYDDSVKGEAIKINNRRYKCNVQELKLC